MTFEEHVLPWLQQRCPDAAVIDRVITDSSDWNGDTFGGFYSSFGVGIEYRDQRDCVQKFTVEGFEMEDLWEHAVSGPQERTGKVEQPPAPEMFVVELDVSINGLWKQRVRHTLVADGSTYVETHTFNPGHDRATASARIWRIL